MEHVVIIGNGISGITAARHIRKLSDKKITIISDETDYFFSRTALMYVYMGHMRWQDIKPYEDWFWEKNGLELKKGLVLAVDHKRKRLQFKDDDFLNYDKLILATGSVTQTFGWEGQDLKGVQGLISKQDLDRLELNAPNREVCPNAVIVGGGLIGIELAEMLHSRKINITMLIREPAVWENMLPLHDAKFISNHIESHGIRLRHHTQLDRIIDNGQGRVKSVMTTDGEEIDCDLVGIATGVTPNISYLKNSDIEIGSGILVDRYLQTNIENIYAIGDCAQQRKPIGLRPPIEAVWYTGRMMGETVAQTICGNQTEYRPGNWFNSAKFFDIELQTYGWVLPKTRKIEHEHQFNWQHKDKDKAITVAYRKDNGLFLGINSFGIRMRHEIFDQWLNENRSIDFVMKNLDRANFDPEFYKRFEGEILGKYHSEKRLEVA